jgi:hypothetical protein
MTTRPQAHILSALSLATLLAASAPAQAQQAAPTAITVSAATVAMPGTYGIVEFDVDAGETVANPFDPAELAVDGRFTHADGTRLTLPAFWAGERFKLRFCPTKPGDWSLETTATSKAGQRTSTRQSFTVAPSQSKGFLRPGPANSRYFQFDSGDSAYLVGLNLCWPGKEGLASYDARFKKLAEVGGNFTRLWTTQERRLESQDAGLGRYDL